MPQLRVLVVGASIAGPTAAYWLAKAGANVTVIERFPELRTSGQNIDIRTAGVSVMRKMRDMEASVRAKTTSMDGISFVRPDGRPYGTLRSTGDPDQQSLVSEYEIFRGDLAKIIVELTKDNDNIKYVFDEQISSIRHGEDPDAPITVEFMNGHLPTAEYDLVVACDGSTSRTRAIGFECGVRDHIKPVNTWAAYFSIEQDILQGSTVGQAYSAPGGRMIGVGPDPSGLNRVTMMAIHPRSDSNSNDKEDPMIPFRTALKQGDAALKQYVANHYRGSGWKTDEILQGMLASKDFYASEIVQVKTPTLHRGRFVLVGDAGYAAGPTGGGTSLALAGAYMLAGEVARHTTEKGGQCDMQAALTGYEQRMTPLIAEMQKIPPLVPGIFAPQSAWLLWLRNQIFAFVCWSGVVDLAQRWFGSAFASAETYPLPEFEWVA